MLLRVIAQRLENSPSQRLEEGLLGLAKIHPRGGLGLWISQSRSKISSRCYQSPMLDPGTSYSPGTCRLAWNSSLASTKKSGRDRNEHSASSSQVWHRDDNPQWPRFCLHKLFSCPSFLSSLRHCVRLFYWSEMAARKHPENHLVEQKKKMIPLIRCENYLESTRQRVGFW